MGETVQMLFRGAVEASLPSSIQTLLKQVVGLSTLEYPMWSAYITQYVDNDLEQRERNKKDLAALQAQLAKSQLKELRDKVNQGMASAKQMPQHQGAPPMQSPSQTPYP